MLPTYIVQPDSRGGYALSGPDLPHALWFTEEVDAVSLAFHHLRASGGRVVVLDSRGYAITEHVPPARHNWLQSFDGRELSF